MIVNTILNIILMRTFLKHGGLALATALSSTLNLILLLALIRKKIGKLNLGNRTHTHHGRADSRFPAVGWECGGILFIIAAAAYQRGISTSWAWLAFGLGA